MINFLRISPCDSGDGIKLYTECEGVKNTYTVSAEFFLESGIVKGAASKDILYDIKEEEKLYSARRTAIRILSSGQCSAKRLYEKLRRRGFTHECAKNASDYVLEKGYIDEQWQIESYLKELVEKKYIGRRKILPMLVAKGYSSDKILSVLDERYTDDDFKAARQSFLVKKFGKAKPETYEEAEEMKKALYKQGY
ncbi:MAG: RecX family transcriptional regulator [Clostridia bacterium]|nr:RecX family transcriptional regulator [Clostridia bacterium]